MNQIIDAFCNPENVARYTDGPTRMVHGYAGIQRMAMLLLAERVPVAGRILVLGAGGGLELKAFAPDWTFDGVDPAAPMLDLARKVMGPVSSRSTLHLGAIDIAPPGPFDGATCLLTLHFLPVEDRRRTLLEVRRRLKPGAPFIVAHLSFSEHETERASWLDRYVAFGVASGIEPEMAASARSAIAEHLAILSPEQDGAILRDTGFSNVRLFYVGFTFRGWVAYA
jgi:tRNA (cmo5U34)-methyltransferase